MAGGLVHLGYGWRGHRFRAGMVQSTTVRFPCRWDHRGTKEMASAMALLPPSFDGSPSSQTCVMSMCDAWMRRPVWQNHPKWHASRGARLSPNTKHPKSWLHRTVPSSTPQGRTQTIHVFHSGSNNENEFTILRPFHTTRVFENILLQDQVQSVEFNNGIEINI